MPRTKIQKFIFMFLTVMFSVVAFVNYNIAISIGKMSNHVILLSFREIPLEFSFAFLLELFIANKLAEKIAFKYVDPRQDKPIVIILAITCSTIIVMCPSMSFIATILYDGISKEFFAHWFQKMVYNFPFAFFIQIFFIGPLVRFIFHTSQRIEKASVAET